MILTKKKTITSGPKDMVFSTGSYSRTANTFLTVSYF